MNQQSSFLCALLLLGVVGCSSESSRSVSVSDGKGTKIVVNSSGSDTKVSISGSNGEEVTADGSNTVFVEKDGSKSTIVTNKDGSSSVTTKDGSASIGGNTQISESELGVPFYPGSVETAGSNFKFEGPKGKSYSCTRTTDDAPEKVIEFYKSKVENPASALTDGSGSLSGKLASGANINVAAQKKDGKTVVMVTSTSK